MYQLGISVAERLELRIEGTFPATLSNLCFKLLFIHRPDRHLRAVVKKDVHGEHVLSRFARHLRVNTTGVVAEHAAERTVVVRGWVWPPSQCVRLCSISERVADRPRLDASIFLLWVQLDDMVKIFRPVDDNRNIAALSCQARAPAS